MPIIGKHAFTYTNAAGEKLEFDTQISVNAKGEFSVVIPDELESTARQCGLQIDRPSKNLFARGPNLEDLKLSVISAMKAHLSTEAVRTPVIIYSTDTKVSFWLGADGEIHPNGGHESSSKEDPGWSMIGGLNATTQGAHYTVGIFAQVVDRIDHYRGDHLVSTTYDRCDVGHFKWKEGMEWAYKLNSFAGLRIDYDRAGRLYKQMPYTEQAARFFHDSLLSICRLGQRVHSFFDDTEGLALAIESGTPLLASPVRTAEADGEG